MPSSSTILGAAVAILASVGMAQGAAIEKRYTTINNVEHTFYGCKQHNMVQVKGHC